MCCKRDTEARGLQKLWLSGRAADEFRRTSFSWFQNANTDGVINIVHLLYCTLVFEGIMATTKV